MRPQRCPAARSPRGGSSRRRSRPARARSARARASARARPARGGSSASAITSPTTSIRPRDALVLERAARERSSGQSSSAREPVDLDPVALLRHREVAAPQPGLDVRERARRPRPPPWRRRASSSCRRRRARSRAALPRRARRDARPAARRGRRCAGRAGSAGSAEPELVEEDLRELVVVVLARVDDDLVDPGRRAAPPRAAPT